MAPPDREQHTFPVAGWYGPHPIPDLAAIPRERWPEVFAMSAPRARQLAISRLPERLSEAAELLGMKPGQLARLLTVRGVAQVLAESESG